jgi:SAM-dependent methyltransferase
VPRMDRTDAAPATAASMSALGRYPEPIEEISERDHMYNSAPEPRLFGYTLLGRSALDCIRIVMLSAQKEVVESVLDLPSGHGRVLRHLKAEFPEARLTACDIDHDGVDYCARTFGAEPLYGRAGAPERVGERFDLIWCGSLLTHLDEPQWSEFLDFFEAALVPGGLLVFTTHGRSIAAKLRDPEERWRYLADEEQVNRVLRGYDERGFGYADYDFDEEWRASLSLPASFGISAARPSWVCGLVERRPRLQLVTFLENRWGAHDVVGCVRVSAVEEGKTPLRACYGPEPERG